MSLFLIMQYRRAVLKGPQKKKFFPINILDHGSSGWLFLDNNITFKVDKRVICIQFKKKKLA